MRSSNEERDRIDITGGHSGVDVHPTVVARVVARPRALACGRVIVVPRPRAGKGTSLSLEAVVASVGRPLELPWVDPCWPVVLGGLASP